MLIGIDASRYGMQKKTGVEKYSDKIIENLCLLSEKEEEALEIILYCREGNQLPEKLPKNCKTVVIKGKKLWTLIHLSKYLKKNKPDLLFVPSHVFPINLGKKNLIMIHDVAFINFSEAYSPLQKIFLKLHTKRACKIADQIIVPSEATKKDLIQYFKCPTDKIKVIYHGFEGQSTPKKEIQEKEAIISYIGRIETKKNLIRLIKAFANFRKKHSEWKMVLAGPFGHGHQKILQEIKDNNLENDISLPEYISEQEKSDLLEKSSIFSFVSLSEGFGFPILEAFSHKTPVLTSEGSATQEIGGDAACYVNPLDTSNIQEGLEKLAYNQNYREELINNMDRQLKKFTWKKCSEATWKLIKAVLKN